MIFKEWEERCQGLCKGDLLRVLEEQIPESLQRSFSKSKRETESRGMQPGVLVGMIKTTISRLPQVLFRIGSQQEFMQSHVPRLLELGDNVYV